MSRHARAVDANQREVTAALTAAGIWWHSTAAMGGGFPDLLVWHRGWFIFEVKDGTQPPSKRRLTPAEQAFFAGCPGPVHVALCPEDVFAVLGLTATLTRPVTNARGTAAKGRGTRAPTRRQGSGGGQP